MIIHRAAQTENRHHRPNIPRCHCSIRPEVFIMVLTGSVRQSAIMISIRHRRHHHPVPARIRHRRHIRLLHSNGPCHRYPTKVMFISDLITIIHNFIHFFKFLKQPPLGSLQSTQHNHQYHFFLNLFLAIV